MRSKIRNIGRGGKIVLTLVVAGMAFGIATGVQAAIPSANGEIYGCYAKPGTPSQGALRVVDQGNPCKPGENPLSWSQQGPQGIPGPQGPQGPTGPEGPKTVTERQGMVGSDGTIYYSSGYTVTHTPGSGVYVIDFPCGTFNYDLANFPVISITAFSASQQTWGTGQEVIWGCGAFEATIGTYGHGDHQFMFNVVQHNGPNVPGKAPVDPNAKTVINPS
jgi:hypothetical protein